MFNGSWRHVRLCTSSDLVYRFGSALLPIYNQTLGIAAAEEVNKDERIPDEAMLVMEELLVFGGVSMMKPQEMFSVTSIKFSNSPNAPVLKAN